MSEASEIGVCQNTTHAISNYFVDNLHDSRTEWPAVVPQPGDYKLQIYSRVASHSTFNAFGARIPVRSLLKIEQWRDIATGHPDDDWLLDLLTYGFPLQYSGPANPSGGVIKGNHPSGRNYSDPLRKFIDYELRNATLVGKTLINEAVPVLYIEADSCMLGGGATMASLTQLYRSPAITRQLLQYSIIQGARTRF